jgi:hypothetical protein
MGIFFKQNNKILSAPELRPGKQTPPEHITGRGNGGRFWEQRDITNKQFFFTA